MAEIINRFYLEISFKIKTEPENVKIKSPFRSHHSKEKYGRKTKIN